MQCSQARWRGVERGAPRWRTFASSPLHLFTIETREAKESEMSEFWVPSMQQEEIGSIHVEITSVDRKIRAVEKAESAEAREEATDLVAEEAKGYAYALGQARQRMERDYKTITL
jgi:hypothetical protein